MSKYIDDLLTFYNLRDTEVLIQKLEDEIKAEAIRAERAEKKLAELQEQMQWKSVFERTPGNDYYYYLSPTGWIARR